MQWDKQICKFLGNKFSGKTFYSIPVGENMCDIYEVDEFVGTAHKEDGCYNIHIPILQYEIDQDLEQNIV